MRRALLKKFALVLLAALFLNSLIFYGASSRSILNSTREDMLYILESADSLLEYGGDLNGQVARLELVTDRPVDDTITSVGIRAHDFEPLSDSGAQAYMEREDANLIKVYAPSISEMPFEWYITLQNGLWWKKGKDIHTHETAGLVPDWLRVEPSALLLLTGEL